MKRQIKKRSYVREKITKKDYAGTEISPYREWLDTRGDYNQEHEAEEPVEANPDGLAETDGLYYQGSVNDDRLDAIRTVMETLTERQKEILRMCGNEGRTMENCAAILGISKGAVQTTISRIKKKVAVLQKKGLLTYKERG